MSISFFALKQYILQQKYLKKWIGSLLLGVETRLSNTYTPTLSATMHIVTDSQTDGRTGRRQYRANSWSAKKQKAFGDFGRLSGGSENDGHEIAGHTCKSTVKLSRQQVQNEVTITSLLMSCRSWAKQDMFPREGQTLFTFLSYSMNSVYFVIFPILLSNTSNFSSLHQCLHFDRISYWVGLHIAPASEASEKFLPPLWLSCDWYNFQSIEFEARLYSLSYAM